VAEAVVTTQRDWGNRTDRKNAKTKYTLERVGVETFKAAHQQVKADKLAVFRNRHEVHIIGVQIDIVLRRDHHRRFEFTRQIGLAEDRFLVGGGNLFLI
jgi:sulfite reductase beta subunit-like hemoprotein